ncbi:MAG: NADH-quinone oxidoreductase subunit E, partial [Phascolarctobacterium sp.]|nr:NADH-quinone oxidoreductase subunit E [Phascolarctobacterium sp.]
MDMFFVAVLCYSIGILTLFAPHHMQMMAHYVANLAAVMGSGLVFFNAWSILAGDATIRAFRWGSYTLTCDGWSAPFLMLTGLAGIIASVYALGYAESYEGKRLRMLNGLWNLFICSMVLVLLAGDALSFLLFWEIMAVASFLLVNHEAEKRTTWNAAYQYLVMTSIGTAAIMIAFFLTTTFSEGFSFAAMSANTLKGGWLHATFAAAFIGFALKAGLVPLHVWLPNAHPAAPSHVSALMSGVMLKIALYGFGRFMFDFLPEWNYWWAVIVMVIGLISAFLGVLYAQMEVDIKRILAYSSVENMGIIFAAFGCGMLLKVVTDSNWCQIGFLAALLHAFNHSIMKVLMFMSAGSIMHGTGSKNLELFGGLARKMPYTALFTFIGAMSLSALPLTNGFVGEWMVLQSFITLAHNGPAQDVRLWSALAFILMGLTGALALGCFVRYFGITFLGAARSKLVDHAHESDIFMLAAMGMSSALVLLVGIFPAYVIELLCKAIDMSDYMVIGLGGRLI